MEKNIILRYIIDKKENIKTSKVFPRTIAFEFTENFVNVLIGPRRAGKTYFLYDLILNKLKLKDEEFIFMDFEDAALSDIKSNDIVETINLHEEYYKKKPRYLFFDEIQGVDNWDKAIRTLFETKKYVIVNEFGSPLHGISIPGQTPMFIERTVFGGLRAKYITAEKLSEIEGKDNTAIIPLYFTENLQSELEAKFPQGRVDDKNYFKVYIIE